MDGNGQLKNGTESSKLNPSRRSSHAKKESIDAKSKENRKEWINHPQHYGGDTTYEVIKVLEAWGLDFDFNLGNAVKYIARAGKKFNSKTIEDLKKAAWYLNRRIERLEQRG